jgi:hypothetical protein
MAQALQQSQSQMARAGSQSSQSGTPQEMTGADGFNANGTAKNGSSNGQKGSSSSSPGPGLGGPGLGVGGKIPPIGAPTPGKKIDTMIPGQKGKGEQLVIPYRGSPDVSDPKASYYATYPSARQAAEDALNKERIPPGHQKQVKEYFDAIQPR